MKGKVIKSNFVGKKRFKSFTLIETLVTIGLIAFLASIVIIAINPARQFALARNTQRRANIRTILDAIYQNSIDNQGVFNCHHSIPTTTSTISSSDVDLYDCLVPAYIADLPYDPSEGYFNSKTDYDTKYQIRQDPDTGRIIIYAPEAELGEEISIARSGFTTGTTGGVAWYNSSWNYRRPITITTGSASTPANYQVKIDVSYDSDMLADFADIRFTDSDGKTLIDHWRESFLASNSAVFWVEVPDSIPANSSKTIYMYYGNPSASSASNGNKTFDFFDDFPGTSLDLNKWEVDVGNPMVNNALYLDDEERLHTRSWDGNTTRVRFKTVWPNETGKSVEGYTGLKAFGPARGCYFQTYDGWYTESRTGDETWQIEKTEITSYADEHILQILKNAGTEAKFYVDDLLKDTDTTHIPDTEIPIFFHKYGSNNLEIDWVFASKYISPEPTSTVGSEETR